MNTKSLSLLLGLSILITGCVFEPGTVKVNVNRKSSSTSSSPKSISSVSVINNQIKITGTGLEGVTSLNIRNNNLNETFSIESASATQIIGNASHAVSIGIGQIFDLILNSAEGASTFPVSFSLENGSVTAAMLSSMSASPGQILIYNGAAWVPSSVSSSQLYMGTWNASANTPDIDSTSPQAGDYYVVTTAGTHNLVNYAIGDWIISNGSSWSKLSNSSSVVGSFNGRTGLVVPVTGDYTWAQITKTSSKLEDIADINITGRADQKVLKWDATNSKWIMGDDIAGAGAPGPGSITSTEIFDGTVANADLAGAIDQSKITNLTADLASKLGLTSLSATAPLVYNNTSGTFAISNATTLLDGAMSAADKTKINGLETLSAGNGVLERFSGTIRSNTCADGEVLKWVTLTGWTCSSDSSTDATKQSTLTDSAGLAGALSDESGTGLAVFNSAPTILNPVITNISPAADFTLTQNAVAPFTSVEAGAVGDTLYLKAGKVGIGTNSPGSALDVKGILRLSGSTSGYVGFEPAAAAGATIYKLPATQGTSGQVLTTDGVATNATLSWVTPATSSISLVGDIGGSVGANTIGNDKVTSTHLLDGTILNADINNAANIAVTKLGTGAVSTTEFNYLTGVTSSIQTQLSSKEPTITGGATTDYIRGDKTLSVFATDVINSVLSTFSPSALSKPALANTDTVAGAFNKVQKYISDIDGDYVSKSASTNNTVSGVVTFNTIGSLNIGYTPTNATDAVSKAYVDGFGPWTRGTGANSGDVYRSAGNVGIGTSSPLDKLDIVNGRLRIEADDAFTQYYDNAGSNPDTKKAYVGVWDNRFVVQGRTDALASTGDLFNISLATGNVGIGTTSPDQKFHVTTGSDGTQAQIGSGYLGSFGGNLYMTSQATFNSAGTWTATGTSAASVGSVNDGSIRFWSDSGLTNGDTFSPSARMIINSSGNVGIGTTNPGETLDVRGNLRIGNSDSNYISFNGTSGDGSGMYSHTFIGERFYSATESSELFLFKGNDSDNASGPDRIRLAGGNILFDTFSSPDAPSGSFETVATSPLISTKMIINGVGNVGIGTTTPAYKLDVSGSGNFTTSTTGGIQLSLENTTMTSANKRLRFVQDNASNITRVSNNSDSINYMSYQMDTGYIGIGTTSPGVALDVAGTIRSTTGSVYANTAVFSNDRINFTTPSYYVLNGASVGVILANGATSWAAQSDRRLKKEIRPLENALDKINHINGVTYNYNVDPKSEPRRVGVIAQEVKAVLPEVVSEDKKGFLSVRYSELVPLTINAIKELYLLWFDDHHQIEELKAENAELREAVCEMNPKAKVCGRKQKYNR